MRPELLAALKKHMPADTLKKVEDEANTERHKHVVSAFRKAMKRWSDSPNQAEDAVDTMGALTYCMDESVQEAINNELGLGLTKEELDAIY